MPKGTPPPPRPSADRSNRKKTRDRHFVVSGVDLGNGDRVVVRVVVGVGGVSVRKRGSRRVWWLPLRDAARAIAVVAQRRMAEARMGTSREEERMEKQDA